LVSRVSPLRVQAALAALKAVVEKCCPPVGKRKGRGRLKKDGV
jgi:hypothetical protein